MLAVFLSQLVKRGTLTAIWPGGKRRTFGMGAPHVTMRLHGRWTPLALSLRPELTLGEAYMDGRLTVEEGTIADVLQIYMMNNARDHKPTVVRISQRLRRWFRRLSQYNPARRARRNAAHHYDLSAELYALFLDSDWQYSCAYFRSPQDSLETAQIAKKRHLAAKLLLDRPGLKVLDIGSGWGGLALDIARDAHADVLGITLSTEQLALARERAHTAGLAERCRFELRDYRFVEGPFDRIVSVGMFEAVGVGYYNTFFCKIHDLLTEDGVALLHTIARGNGPGATSPWITKYIFPGGSLPALSEILPAIERAGLYVTDVETLRLHYAETLKAWRERFRANWAKAAALYDERFCRMWEFYLAGSEMGFRYDNLLVYQIQLAKRTDTLPLTRDYMYESERTMRFAGLERMPRAGGAA